MSNRKDKAFPFRVVFTLIILVFNFLIIPQLLTVPLLIKQQSLAAFKLSFFGGLKVLPEVFDIWLWLQPIAISLIVWIWLTGRSLVNMVYNSELPQAAGHGQHGTARWQEEKEIDKNFHTHSF